MHSYDVIVIGGGPAGLMSAAAAGASGAKVLLLEKGDRLGRKLIISGGGRCNVTNRKPYELLVKNIPANGRFMFGALARFGPEEIIQFFESLGIRLKQEDNDRMFPVTDRAITVANALIAYLKDVGVAIRLNAPVERLTFAEGRTTGVRLKSGEEICAGAVVVAVGGKSVPKTGSTGDGYEWARQAGHHITQLYPTEVPLKASDPWVRQRVLQGLSLQDIVQTLYGPDGKRLTSQRGDMIFTHFGLSGPVSLRTSHYVSSAQLKHGPTPLRLTIDLFPDRPVDAVAAELTALCRDEPKRAVKNVLKAALPERLVPLLLEMAGVSPEVTYAHLPREGWQELCRMVKAFPVTITGTLSLELSFVTGGGVDVREIDPKTMGSRLMPGLFFAGEVMDVHAHTGGYNITVAFSSGRTAGTSAAAAATGQACITKD